LGPLVNTRGPSGVFPIKAPDVHAAIGLQIRELRYMTAPAAPETPRDPAVVEAARAGDHDAFGHLYASYGCMVHGILMARVPCDEVDDLVQDVFLTAFRKLDTLRDSAAFGGWLAMIARNRAHDYHRHAPEITELSDDMAAGDDSEVEAEAVAILAVIQTLPEAYRETLVLRLVEGMTGPEIAARTGLTAASVRVNLHRGMKQLREKLGGGRHA
jgi:RNA polymerase sigma-70 factor, ECF subfamily